MATFELTGPDGGTYHVDAPDEQSAISAFSAFNGGKSAAPSNASAPAAPPPDKYHQAALDDMQFAKDHDIPDPSSGYGASVVHGMTLGADNTLLAAFMTPPEMIKRGTWSPSEAYDFAKARQDEEQKAREESQGTLGKIAEGAGGVIAGGGLAKGGITAARYLAPDAGILARIGASTADAAGLGGISGFNEGNGLNERLTNAAKGAGTGALVGAAVPAVAGLVSGVTKPIFANWKAMRDPEGFANSQIARAASESGQTPAQLGQTVQDANAAGQPMTLADALGNPGQRMLSTVTRSPGEGRTDAVNFLNKRQAGQGERVTDILDTALGTNGTARQSIDQLTQQAQRESAPLYREALDKQPVWNDRMQQFFDDPITAQGLKEGVGVQRLESLATGQPFNPKDAAITSFNAAGDPVISGVPNMRTINLIKKGWDNILEQSRDPTTGRLALDEKGRALDQVRRSFLNEVDSLNPAYAQARAAYAGPAQVREAVGTGAQAVTRGRAADNIARFNAMTDPTKQGFRTGYADTVAGKIENSRIGANKVDPLNTPKSQAQLDALSLHQGPVQPGQAAPMQKLLNNEQTMFETRAQALGNSKTAENLNDDAAMSVDPHLVGTIGHILHGNVPGAIAGVGKLVANGWTGNTPQVRAAVGRILLDQGVNPRNLQAAIGNTVARIQFIQNLTRNVGRGAAGALAVSRPGQTAN